MEAVWQACDKQLPEYCVLRKKKPRYFWIVIPGWKLTGAHLHYEFIYRRGVISAEFHVESSKALNEMIQHLAQRIAEIDGLDVKFSDTWGNGCMFGVTFATGVPATQMVTAMRLLIEKSYPEINAWFENGMQQVALPVADTTITDGVNAMTLNTILYGPPGTGKTYETIHAALQILDPAAAADYKQVDDNKSASLEQRLAARTALKARFDKLSEEQRVRFVTFHQSFSYEDFVEGLRAETDDDSGKLRYDVSDGVFKSLCRDAGEESGTANEFSNAIAMFQEKLDAAGDVLTLKTVRGKLFDVQYDGGNSFRIFPKDSKKEQSNYRAGLKDIKRLAAGVSRRDIHNASYVEGVLSYLRSDCGLAPMPVASASSKNLKPFVLIIDEINRGNISRIFGELITLIEPSKRAGADEALSVTLPYSKEPFSVPDNVYIIGTMNTADRSLAGLDLALRRRFTFTEMPPKPELLEGVALDGINIGQMLRVMNQRISVLLDRDHCIGHAYFMPLQKEPTLPRLAAIFRQAILPLLQEYFFEDWERIRWVLNDQNKPQDLAFIVKDTSLDLSGLFAGVQDKLRQTPQWMVNDKAFKSAAAFSGIAANLGTLAQDQPAINEANV